MRSVLKISNANYLENKDEMDLSKEASWKKVTITDQGEPGTETWSCLHRPGRDTERVALEQGTKPESISPQLVRLHREHNMCNISASQKCRLYKTA